MTNSSNTSQQSYVYNPLISIPTCNYQIYADVVLKVVIHSRVWTML